MNEKSDQEIIADIKTRRDKQHRQQRKQQQQHKQPPQVLPPPSEPMQVARQFVQEHCLHNGSSDAVTLRYWHGGWWAWRLSHWVEVENRAVRALLYAFTEHAVYMGVLAEHVD
jgi:hypothetical protein